MVYFFPIFLNLTAAIFYDIAGYVYKKKIIWYTLLLYLILLFGLRYMVGGDTYAYMDFFNSIDINDNNIYWNLDFQPLFVFMNVLMKTLYPNFVSFQILHAVILNVILFNFLSNYARYYFSALLFCILIFYINFSVEILRESMAVMIFLISYKYYKSKKWLNYYIWIFIAMQFHLSAIALLLLPLFYNLKFNRKFILYSFIAILIFLKLDYFFDLFLNISKVGSRVDYYKDAFYGYNSMFLFWILRFFTPCIICFWAKYILRIKIQFESLLCIMCLLGLGALFNGMVFMRLTNYILPFYCITLSDILIYALKRALISNKITAIIFAFCITISSGLYSFNWPPGYYKNWIPYYSVFSFENQIHQIIKR